MQTGNTGKTPSPPAGAHELPGWLQVAALAAPQSSGPSAPGRGRAAQRCRGGAAPRHGAGWELFCPDPPVPAFILERGLAPSGPARRGQRNQSGPITRYPPAPRQQRLPQPLRTPGAGASSAACFPPKVTPRRRRRLPKAGAGRAGAGPVGRRVPQPTWPPFAPAPASRTHPAAVTAGVRGWPRAARLRQGRSGAGSQTGGEGSLPAGSCRREAREARTLTHLEGRRKLGCRRGMRDSLLICVTLILASL